MQGNSCYHSLFDLLKRLRAAWIRQRTRGCLRRRPDALAAADAAQDASADVLSQLDTLEAQVRSRLTQFLTLDSPPLPHLSPNPARGRPRRGGGGGGCPRGGGNEGVAP